MEPFVSKSNHLGCQAQSAGDGGTFSRSGEEAPKKVLEKLILVEELNERRTELFQLPALLPGEQSFVRPDFRGYQGFDNTDGFAFFGEGGREIGVVVEEGVFFAVMETVDEPASPLFQVVQHVLHDTGRFGWAEGDLAEEAGDSFGGDTAGIIAAGENAAGRATPFAALDLAAGELLRLFKEKGPGIVGGSRR